jgi:hypothetical protein
MNISIWLPAIAGAALLVYLLLQRTRPASQIDSGARLASLVGIRRAWGEGDASLRRRATALGRWPYSTVDPEVAWWARWLKSLWTRRP